MCTQHLELSQFEPTAAAWGRLLPAGGGPGLELTKDTILVGRSPKCDLQIRPSGNSAVEQWAHALLSNHHARLQREGDVVWVHDTSNNGTWIPPNTILRKGQRRQLHPGEHVCLGNPQVLGRKIRSQTALHKLLQSQTFVLSVRTSVPTLSPKPTQGWLEQDYDVRERLGRGTVGEVFRVIHRASGVERAVKIMGRGVDHEAEILQSLEHPYIVQLHDVYKTQSKLFLVMDYMRGGDLFDRIVARTRYSETQSRRVLRRLLSALYYLHEQRQLVHRDLKPENILLERTDCDISVRISDFGLAKACDKGLQTFCGTPQYFAPEVWSRAHTIAGKGRYGKPADVWSLGICAYVLLTGQPPCDDWSAPMGDLQGVSPLARDFLHALLKPHPHERLTMAQACQHEWIHIDDGDTHTDPLKDPAVLAGERPRLFESLQLESSEPSITVAPTSVERDERPSPVADKSESHESRLDESPLVKSPPEQSPLVAQQSLVESPKDQTAFDTSLEEKIVPEPLVESKCEQETRCAKPREVDSPGRYVQETDESLTKSAETSEADSPVACDESDDFVPERLVEALAGDVESPRQVVKENEGSVKSHVRSPDRAPLSPVQPNRVDQTTSILMNAKKSSPMAPELSDDEIRSHFSEANDSICSFESAKPATKEPANQSRRKRRVTDSVGDSLSRLGPPTDTTPPPPMRKTEKSKQSTLSSYFKRSKR